jgi:alkaline phosphatase
MGYAHIDAGYFFKYGDSNIESSNSTPPSDDSRDAEKLGFPYNQFPAQFGVTTYMAYEESDECYGHGYDSEAAWENSDYVKACATDSAAAATALSTGMKTYRGAIGVDLEGQPLTHIVQIVEDLGLSTGIVTSVQLSHATPAGFVAHNVSRNNYEEIAQEMIYDSRLDVIMGAGHPFFDGNGLLIETPNTYRYVGGELTWSDLISGVAGGDADGDGGFDAWTLIQTRTEFQTLIEGATPTRVLGVLQVSDTLQQGRGGDTSAAPFAMPFIDTVPTLEEMTLAALNILDEDPDGFFLMVEGGAIDWASHANQSGRMIEEELAFEGAVIAALNWVSEHSSWDETLLIVTSDHETGYLTVSAADGNRAAIVNNGAGNMPELNWQSGGHTNSLVPLFAKGLGSNIFQKHIDGYDPVRGYYLDNTDIYKVVMELVN